MGPHDAQSTRRQDQAGNLPGLLLVLVQEGEVVEDQPSQDAAMAAARRIAAETRKQVIVYVVEPRLPTPPPSGTPIDPAALGWREIFRHPDVPAVMPLQPPLQLGDVG